MKTKINVLFIGMVLLIMLGGFLRPLIKPSEIIYDENRVAVLLPKLSIDSFKEKDFQDDFERALSDQIPLSSLMKKFLKNAELSTKTLGYSLFRNNVYYSISSSIYLYNDYLVYGSNSLSVLKSSLDLKSQNINKAVGILPDTKFFFYYIEKDTDINFLNNDKVGVFERLLDGLDNRVIANKFEIDSFDEYKNYFYKTDHHWNYKGSYRAYTDLVKMVSKEEANSYEKEICLKSIMSGSKASSAGSTDIFTENFCAYQFNLLEHDVFINGTKVDSYGDYKTINKENPDTISYGKYYGWDVGLIEFDYHEPKKENLLIIGESYDNAINELLASHFNKTYNVDLRAYEMDMHEPFDLLKFVKKNDILKVLLIGNIDFAVSDTFNIIRDGE